MRAIEALKEKLKQENCGSETWYSLQKAERFETGLLEVESRYARAHSALLRLTELLSTYSNPSR